MLDFPNITILSIEGNIGSGKSTVLKKLKETNPGWIFVDEPVSEWLDLKNEHGKSLLELFYADKRRWSYTFQNVAVFHRFQNLKNALDNIDTSKEAVIVMERSLMTDYLIFTSMLHADGYIDHLEKQIYMGWFNHLQAMLPAIDAHIYVHASPEVCLQRITSRAREGESVIPLEYLKQLDHYHNEWLLNKTKELTFEFWNIKETLDVQEIMAYVEKIHSLKKRMSTQ
jgi:deoxyadenosine/deoxycytidine kinase